VAVLIYVAMSVQIHFVAGKFLTHCLNAGVSTALLLRNRRIERERERGNRGVVLDDVVSR
jgi:hypothetical protein